MITDLIDIETGELVTAEYAYKHKNRRYRCCGCPCPMHSKQSCCSNYHAARNPNCDHDPGCCTEGIRDDNSYVCFDLMDLDEIDRCIMSKPRNGKKEPGESWNPGKPHSEEHKSSPKLLRDIFGLGLCDQKDKRVNDKHMLGDILLNRKTARGKAMIDVDLGKRAIVAKPYWHFDQEQIIRFKLYFSDQYCGEWVKRSAIFDLEFTADDAYHKYVTKLFGKVRGKYGALYDMVLIYGHWECVEIDAYREIVQQCANDSWLCVGYQRAVCEVPVHQIYMPRQMRNK